MESRLLLDVVVRERPTIFQLLPCEDKPLLVWGNSFLVLIKTHSEFHFLELSQFYSYLDLGLHVLDRVAGLHLEGDGLPGESLHEDLHLRFVVFVRFTVVLTA